jgi:hypothetical protein
MDSLIRAKRLARGSIKGLGIRGIVHGDADAWDAIPVVRGGASAAEFAKFVDKSFLHVQTFSNVSALVHSIKPEYTDFSETCLCLPLARLSVATAHVAHAKDDEGEHN